MIIVVQVINTANNYACGRYSIPKEEYDALIRYLKRKIKTELAFEIIGKAITPDEFRPWKYSK